MFSRSVNTLANFEPSPEILWKALTTSVELTLPASTRPFTLDSATPNSSARAFRIGMPWEINWLKSLVKSLPPETTCVKFRATSVRLPPPAAAAFANKSNVGITLLASTLAFNKNWADSRTPAMSNGVRLAYSVNSTRAASAFSVEPRSAVNATSARAESLAPFKI